MLTVHSGHLSVITLARVPIINIQYLLSVMATSHLEDDVGANSFTSCRVSAKQKVADTWAQHRQKSGSLGLSSKTTESRKQRELVDNGSTIPVCRVVRNAWQQLTFDVSRRLLPKKAKQQRLPSSSTTISPRVFPSVVSVLKAAAVSSQVVETLQAEEVVMDILPASYDWQQAIQSSTISRERAFLLLDLSEVVKSRVTLQQTFCNVKLQYRVQHNRDAKLLELCIRLNVALRTNSNMDVEAAVNALQKQTDSTNTLIVDDAGATRKPNGYLRRFLNANPQGSLAVDGPEEVKRLFSAHEILRERQDYSSQSISSQPLFFVLKLPRDCRQWENLAKTTKQAASCCDAETRLVGVSLELVNNDHDSPQQIRDSLDSISSLLDYDMQVDVTGEVTQNMAPFLTDLATSYKVTVDASKLLVQHAGALCSRIIGVKEVEDMRHLYIDDGCYGTLYRDWNTQTDHTPLPLHNARSSQTQTTTVWGPTCDGLDRVCRNVILPKMNVDEWLVFFDMGLASGMGTAFNGFDPPDTAYCVLGYFRNL